jgi:hypothetical protein
MVRDVNSIQLSGSVGEQTGTLGAATGRGVETLLAGKAPRCSGGKISRQLILR